jgi:predicted DNA-binding protein (MmcQ/YjbR family)
MDAQGIRHLCLALPGATESVKWGNDLVFQVGGKMFAVACLDVSPYLVSFKCSPERFAELMEREGFVPAPYLARAHWVAIERGARTERAELAGWLRDAHAEVAKKLPNKVRQELGLEGASGKAQRKR